MAGYVLPCENSNVESVPCIGFARKTGCAAEAESESVRRLMTRYALFMIA